MRYFSGISDINSLTLIYRRLAMLNHPDMGGNPEVMKSINIEYEQLKSHLSGKNKEKNALHINQEVYVNSSPAKIIHIGEFIIIVQSLLTNRKAIFNKKSGICLSNPELKLSIIKYGEHVRL
ncbi:MAG: hypothetical protein C0595_05515 [Marinilabiliales bacterium]|nr:MAG: hypothetical protein C0595_05515 [Marinilabiliales bacterium]